MDLNHRPIDFQSIASTAELSGRHRRSDYSNKFHSWHCRSATAVNHKKDTESSFAKIEDKNLWNFSNWNATHSGSDFKECPTSGELIYDFGAVQTLLKQKILRSATKLVGHFLFKIRTIRNT